MESHSELLKQGWQLHQQREHSRAEALYRRALAEQPGHPAALYFYGRLAFDLRNLDVAADYLARAAAADPSQALCHADLAQTYQMLGRLGEAAASYGRAIELSPDRPDLYVNLGNTLLQAGQTSEAITRYRQALERDPRLADAHSCLGAALEQDGRPEAAAACYRRAIELRPDYTQAQFNLGTLMTRLERPLQALPCLRKAVALSPDFAPARHNLGVALNQLGSSAEARQCLEEALRLDATQPRPHFNLGEVLEQQGCFQEALREYDETLRLDPRYAQARCARGALLLKLGEFQAGWRDYESRVGLPQYDTLSLPQPTWDGSVLGERRLLVHCEQGLGDTLQFTRYVRLARDRAQHLTVASRPELIPLLVQSGYPNVVSRADPLPPFDVHVPLLSLPRIFGTEAQNVPSEVPYLSADRLLVERWREKLADRPGFKVGIHWQGNPAYRFDRQRSIPLQQFLTLAHVPGVVLFGLQKVDGRQCLAELAEAMSMVDLGPELDNDSGPFMDTAAVMQNLDLVITSDTAAAHLAGGLGRRVWVALAQVSEWRWLVERDDSPWYPTMRLFRQARAGDWQEVFERMRARLEALVRGTLADR